MTDKAKPPDNPEDPQCERQHWVQVDDLDDWDEAVARVSDRTTSEEP